MNKPIITFVKKIKDNGEPCKKCAEVEQRLQQAGYMSHIDHTVIADERDADSKGMVLAKQYQVDRAPFFIVEVEGEPAVVYTVYFKLVKDILEPLVAA